MEERDAPDRVLFGCMDSHFCPLIGIGLWLEYCFYCNGYNNQFYFGIEGLQDPKMIKAKAATQLQRTFKNEEFDVSDDDDKKTGTHSIRKFTTTTARRNGCGLVRMRQIRGHDGNPINNHKIDIAIQQYHIALCYGGPLTYVVKEGSAGVSDNWILQHVVPHLSQKFCHDIALVLGKAVLW